MGWKRVFSCRPVDAALSFPHASPRVEAAADNARDGKADSAACNAKPKPKMLLVAGESSAYRTSATASARLGMPGTSILHCTALCYTVLHCTALLVY